LILFEESLIENVNQYRERTNFSSSAAEFELGSTLTQLLNTMSMMIKKMAQKNK